MPSVDQFGGIAVLGGQPVIGQVQVDPRRFDRGMAGLGLDRLKGHSRFSQASQTGMAELVTGGTLEARPFFGAAHDPIDAVDTQTPPPSRALQRHEDRVRLEQFGGRSSRR